MMWTDESLGRTAESSERQKNTRRKGDKKAKMWQIFLLHESDGGLFVGACSVSLLSSQMQKCKGSRPEAAFHYLFICARHRDVDGDHKYKHRLKKSRPLWLCQAAVEECWTTFTSPSFSFFSLFPFISPFSLLANTCVLIPAPSTLSAGGHRQIPSPPFFLLPPPYPVSQLTLVSVMDHIWERLSRSRAVCRSTAREQIWIHSPRGGGRQTLLHNQWTFTGGMNEWSSVSTNLSFRWCISFVGCSHIHDPPRALNTPDFSVALFLVCNLETLQWPWIILGGGLMRAGCSHDSTEI